MNRRSILALLGLAPAAVAVPPALMPRRTHPVVFPGNPQCAKCGDVLYCEPLTRPQMLNLFARRELPIFGCQACGVRFRLPVTYAQAEVVNVKET